MKWFKHMTASWDDEKLAALVGQGGDSGLALYGAYWRFAEIVAKQMEGSAPSCAVTYPVWRWTQLLFVRKSYLTSILLRLKKAGLLVVEGDSNTDQTITVRMPNLLKYRDEYARKSGHAPDNVAPDTEGDTEAETEETISVPTEPHPAVAGVSPEQAIYKLYPRKEGSAAALAAIEKAVNKLVKGTTKSGRTPMVRRDAQKLLYRAVDAYARSPMGQQPDKTKLPHPGTWFNQERWDDDQANWQQTGGFNGKPSITDSISAKQAVLDARAARRVADAENRTGGGAETGIAGIEPGGEQPAAGLVLGGS